MRAAGRYAKRVVGVAVPLSVLMAIGWFLAALQVDDGGTAGNVITRVSAGRIDMEPRTVQARDLPIRVNVASRESLRAWAHGEGERQVAGADPLTPWQQVLFGRFLAIDELVLRYSEHFGNDPIWLFLSLASESGLDPLAKGPEDGDRGLGQVGFASEATARSWASHPKSPYYVPGFDAGRSIWDPEQNILLASIVMRSLYSMPDVETHAHAYARYTRGIAAVDGGRFTADSAIRVERARSYEPSIRLFFAMSMLTGERPEGSRAVRSAVLESPVVQTLLDVDRSVDDGMPMYRALREIYLREATSPVATPWAIALFLAEALTYARLEQAVTGGDPTGDLADVADAMQRRLPRIRATGDATLITFAEQTLHEARAGSRSG